MGPEQSVSSDNGVAKAERPPYHAIVDYPCKCKVDEWEIGLMPHDRWEWNSERRVYVCIICGEEQ